MRATIVWGIILLSGSLGDESWNSDPIWYDGLVEKATYSATRAVYGKPRKYEAIFFTNKEMHDDRTLTKSKGHPMIEVWKHNQIEVIPTPNYDYKYETTSHLTTDKMELTRLDCSSQEFCGTSFKQYLQSGSELDYFGFSYLPQSGRTSARIARTGALVAFNSLPLWLRNYDFAARPDVKISLLPDQKSNRPTSHEPVEAVVRFAGEEDGAFKLELRAGGDVIGTFWMANDRLHVMMKYASADGVQTYELKKLERVNYWTRRE